MVPTEEAPPWLGHTVVMNPVIPGWGGLPCGSWGGLLLCVCVCGGVAFEDLG